MLLQMLFWYLALYGYTTQEVPVNGQSTVDVKLEEDAQAFR